MDAGSDEAADILYDISPLPRDVDYQDDVKRMTQTIDSTGEHDSVPQVDTNTKTLPPKAAAPEENTSDVMLSVPTMTTSESVAESLYFTPDSSANEKLSDVLLKEL